MKTKLLLPHRFQWIGVLVLIPFLTLGILWRFFDFSFDFLTLEHGFSIISVPTSLNLSEKINLTDELALTGIIAGLLLIAFSRQKQEDEFIHQNRLESWQWAVLINFGLLILAIWLVHGWSFIDVMMYNMLTVLIIFIVRFHFVLLRNKSSEA